MKNQIVGLNTLNLRAERGSTVKSTAIRPHKKRVFSEAEYAYLHALDTEELYRRIAVGNQLIALLHRPEMMNMTAGKAAQTASNLRFQQDAIRQIIAGRNIIKE